MPPLPASQGTIISLAREAKARAVCKFNLLEPQIFNKSVFPQRNSVQLCAVPIVLKSEPFLSKLFMLHFMPTFPQCLCYSFYHNVCFYLPSILNVSTKLRGSAQSKPSENLAGSEDTGSVLVTRQCNRQCNILRQGSCK